MKENFDAETRKVLKRAEKEMFDLNHPYVGSEHMILAILYRNNAMAKFFYKFGITYKNFKDNLIKIVGVSRKKSELVLYTPLLKRVISNAKSDAIEENSKVFVSNLIIALLEEGEGIAIRILLNMNVDLNEMYNELKDNKITSGSYLKEFAKNLNNNNEFPLSGRDTEINSIIEILLRKNKNNPLLIGEAGVGKTAIVYELARRIKEKKVPEELYDYKILEIDTGSLIAGTRYRGDFEERLNKIINEVRKSNYIILFIDEIHTLMNCGGSDGAIDAANILKPYLAKNDIKIIGATTIGEYKNSIFKDKAMDRRFQIINIVEPSCKETMNILNNIKSNYEKHHNVIITDENIKDIVKLSDKYIYNRYNPDKSIDILDMVCAHVKSLRPNKKNILYNLNNNKEKILLKSKYKNIIEKELNIKNSIRNCKAIPITKDDILKVIEHKINMPILDNFNKKLNCLESKIKKNILGQDEAISKVVHSLKEKYLIDNTKPLSILLTGSKGVGKTYFAKVLASLLFGEDNFIRIDLNEYNNEYSFEKLIGNNDFHNISKNGILSKVKEHPYSIILLDEIEKANYKVQQFLFKILKDGYYINCNDETIHLENVTFILTSNLKSKVKVGFEKNKNVEYDLIDNELINAVDNVIFLNKIDFKSAKSFIEREKANIIISKEDINKIIIDSNYEVNGIRGIQKELNKYKINKILSKV